MGAAVSEYVVAPNPDDSGKLSWLDSAEASDTVAGDSSYRAAADSSSLHLEVARLGRYVLAQLLDRGSFGAVWLAYDPQLDRRVAIKVMHMRRRDVAIELRQMFGEAQMMAQISHPNVVAVHDVQVLREVGERELGLASESETRSGSDDGGGSDSDSRPRGLYIVMEFLAGESLRDWIRGSPHSWAETLSVFAQAAEGLAAAHAEGLVHRDFKPANAMFGVDGRLRVLDFGLARPTSSAGLSSSGTQRLTVRGESNRVVGTPAYMSPEQHLGKLAEAASDQFSFCASLYEALYGHRPFAGRGPTALGRAKLAGALEPVGRTKVPARILTVLRRGMALDPEDRFPNMVGLLAALLDDPSLRRRRWAAMGLLVAVVAGSGYGLAQIQAQASTSCEPPAGAFRGIWDGQVRAEVAERVMANTEIGAAILLRVESSIEAFTQRWRATYREACVSARMQGRQFGAGDPQHMCLERARLKLGGVTAILREPDPGVFARAAEATGGLPRVAACLELRATPIDRANRHRRDALLAVEGELARAEALRDLGRYDQALEAADVALDHAVAAGDDVGAANALRIEARVHHIHSHYPEALAATERAASYAAQASDRETLAWIILDLVDLHGRVGEFTASRGMGRFAEAYVRELGPELDVQRDFVLGKLEGRLHNFEAARGLLNAALADGKALYGEDSPKLAIIHSALGILYADRDGGGDEAAAHYVRALALYRGAYGDHHPSVAGSLNNLATLRAQRGQFDGARADFRTALELESESFGLGSPKLVPYLMNIAALDLLQGRFAAALEGVEAAWVLAKTGLPEGHPLRARVLLSRARLLRISGDLDRAIADLRTALVSYEEKHGTSDPVPTTIRAEIAEYLRLAGRGDEAAQIEEVVVGVLAIRLPGDASMRGKALRQLSRIYALQGEDERALEFGEQLVEHRHATVGRGQLESVLAVTWVLRPLLALGRTQEAALWGERARRELARSERKVGAWKLHEVLAEVELAQGRSEEARRALESALADLEAGQGWELERARIQARLDALSE